MITLQYQKLMAFYSREGRMPTYTEMMSLFNFRSKNAVYNLVNKLVEADLVLKDRLGRLQPSKAATEVPFLGLVTAGLPAAVDALDHFDTLNLNDFLIDKKDKTFILEVDGDSMIEAHIDDGDLVIAEKTDTARDGDIVIAKVDGEFTMKYFRRKGTKVWLDPANKRYEPIYPEMELEVVALVKGVIRKY